LDLKSLSNDELLSKTERAIEIERNATTEVIRLFQEIADRKLFLSCGYSSLFAMATERFGLCGASAQLRINAMRLVRDVPVVQCKIESGKMSLTVAAHVQTFLYNEKKSDRAYSQNAKLELVEACTSKSVREVRREFVRRNPEIEKRETVRYISEDRMRVTHSISHTLEEKLKRIKALWSHVSPDMTREELLDRMADLTLDQIDPARKTARAKKRTEKLKKSGQESLQVEPTGHDSRALHAHEVSPTLSRKIPAETARIVNERNQGQGCAYIDRDSGHRCGSDFQLQIDHIKEFSRGGTHDIENLQILCAQHNRWRWESRQSSISKDAQSELSKAILNAIDEI
jgi:hypothetical protein